MKRDLLRILFISAISGIVITIGVYLFQKPSFTAGFNLIEQDKLGTAISGLTAPVIGLISTVLLYLALSKQTESNNEQKFKNESDILFLLINQLDLEINSFRINQSRQDKNGNAYEHPDDIGATGIWNFSKSCTDLNSRGGKLSQKRERFDQQFEASAIVMIIESYALIERRIITANLAADMKELFQSKLRFYYDLKLKEALEMLADAFKRYQLTDELMPKRIIQFVSSR
ncbi:hypothetical protein [Chitinophaga filiformis]|uniref:Phage abortive infection protein n=1 Tax=Chitinophaga filiformis TaxID=104663 RepID=A0A1G7MEB7_CHIFI|nr:hypothetical protein [Chitinophaga filiformis]SDF60117.1 hypothetical protein SAMN04488121_102393 [Chitinophaga filiformis]